MYQHQQHVYPGASLYPQYPPQRHSPRAQEGEAGGTWWYVPSQPDQHTPQHAYGAGPSTYPYYPQAHTQRHTDGSSGGSEFSGAPGSHPMFPTYAPASPSIPSSSSAPSPIEPGGSGRERSMIRRPYHPNPPAHRSDWVMWAGNVPSDAVHDELWRFFAQPPGDGGSAAGSSSRGERRSHNGVLSIFLISRSSCVFVNYETEAHLQVAIARFNGVPLRVDPRCGRLLCRVRRKDDDLRAGVGGQRGSGMHTKWVKAKQKAGQSVGQDQDSISSASASDLGRPSSGSHSFQPSLSALSIGSSDDDSGPTRPPPRPHAAGSNSSGSHTSTDSGLLRQHFPQRYFILKSLTQDDLDLSVQTGVWATQKHNEGILDRAFRTSKDVFLVFSVNKSGEFYGYARMAGPIGQGDGSGQVTWARRGRTISKTSASASGRSTLPTPPHAQILNGDRHVDNSPQPFPTPTPTGTPLRPNQVQSAPPALGKPHRNISNSPPAVKSASLDQDRAISSQRREAIDLDKAVPFRAMRSSPVGEVAITAAAVKAGRSHEQRESLTGSGSGSAAPLLGSVTEEAMVEGDRVVGEPRKEGWGEDFKLQWLCTDRLPFERTRHIRNPWNHNLQIKVSRDGTEIEPMMGQALLEEWRLYLVSKAGAQTPMPNGGDSAPVRSWRAGGGGRAGSRS
ncbi:YT521-B-like domain-containing protein [Mycena albidolilacea]|uniref:YT521-B-like domain-containing protein n=1 Tax=Mycena albidolilacea TaxID=1033008 RepID=A0AAD7E6S3_9AGAR|nr:YT521-B-like domain-containing protein [Mycena albidolilacea]